MSDSRLEGYALTLASDVGPRDGMGLELSAAGQPGAVLAEVFFCDADGSMTVSTFDNELPLAVIEALIEVAKRQLPPTR
jgi:hypothetical protein